MLKINASLPNVRACEAKLDQEGKPEFTKDGKPKFVVAYEVEVETKVGGLTIKSKEIETCTSLIKLEKTDKPVLVELNQFAMADKTGKAKIYNQVKAVL